jgi:hypothetical protein
VSKPPVWRRVLVHAGASLGDLHQVIVAAMGWDDSHLHMFSDDSTRYGTADADLDLKDEDEFALADVLVEPGDRLRYLYDFGDDWDHDIKLEKVLPPDADPRATAVPVCLARKGACPPEDCGGAWGYADLKATIADPPERSTSECLSGSASKTRQTSTLPPSTWPASTPVSTASSSSEDQNRSVRTVPCFDWTAVGSGPGCSSWRLQSTHGAATYLAASPAGLIASMRARPAVLRRVARREWLVNCR